MEKSNFLLGLDVGTDSIGWAATDKDFKLMRLKGKTAWGAHIFSEAESAKARRGFRTSGRRLERRKRRIELLNMLFEPLLSNKDQNFLLRLKESAYFIDDKTGDKSPHALFGDRKLERDFHKNYPTIWHLRRELCNNTEKSFEDIRCVYLAIHHIIKYRGNFLREGNIDPTKFDYSIFDDINRFFKELIVTKSDEDIDDIDYEFINKDNQKKFIKTLNDRDQNKNDKKKVLQELICIDEGIKTFIQFFITLIVGGEFSIEKLGEEYEQFEKQKITLSNFDDKADEYAEIMADNFAIVEYAKIIYDFVSLQEILGGKSRLSDAFANMYDSHHQQLKALKKVVRYIDEKKETTKTSDSLFYLLFYKKDEQHNYASFVGHNSNLKKKTSIHEFNKFVLDNVGKYEDLLQDNKDWNGLKILAKNDMLCETICYRSTSVIPHQLHENELNQIIDNAGLYHPLIKDIKDKLISIFKFRVPYYCGPLDDRSIYSNVVRKQGKEFERVLPWNFDDIIDKEKTKENFMNKLTNQCTYLIGENVLPKQSIVYQDFVNLNRLNKLVINGLPIEQKIKKDLFDNLISKNKKTTIKGVKRYLINRVENYKNTGVTISGINENDDFVSDSRAIFSKCFDLNDTKQFEMIERIIYLSTIYCDSPRDAESLILKEIKNLTTEQIKIVKTFRSNGWGTLSRKLIKGLKYLDDNGVVQSIYDILHETTFNFMQVLNDARYGFIELIKNENDKFFLNKGYGKDEKIDEIITSTPPKMRRSVFSALAIVDELTKIKKQEPDVIAIEVTRTNDPKKKGRDGNEKSRRKEIERVISSVKGSSDCFSDNLGGLSEELNRLDDKLSLKGKHIYLYFKQLGFDLYTGKRIDINDVLDSTKYDIDHIIPQRLIKDDSLDNLVLVAREQNQEIKGGIYPIPESIRKNPEVKKVWDFLHNKKVISDKKYNNLIRATDITDEELETFINAQINVINQSNKVLRDIFSIKYPNTKLIFSKAQYPTLLRNILALPKLRDLNDTHHAVDAYLNIVTGTLLNDRFGNMALIKKRISMSEEEQRFTFNMDRYLVNKVFDKEETKTSFGELVFNTALRHDMILTYRRSYQDNAFYNMTIYGVGENKTPIPLHTDKRNPLSNYDRYGSYQGLIPEYHLIATIEKKLKKDSAQYRTFVPVYHLVSELCKKDEKKLLEEVKAKIDLNDNEVLKDINIRLKVYPNQKVRIGGATYLLCTSNEKHLKLKPIDPIFLSYEMQKYLSLCLKHQEKDKRFNDCLEDRYEFFTDKNQNEKHVISKSDNLKVINQLIELANNPKYYYCPMIQRMKEYAKPEVIDAFNAIRISEQIIEIRSCISLFGRKSEIFAGGVNFRKSKAAILNEKHNPLIIINESITGLFSQQVKL